MYRAACCGWEPVITDILKRLGCLIGRHSPARRKVHYDGHLKIGPCKYCGIALEQAAGGRWVAKRGV